MAIVRHRTFTFALLDFADSDLSAMKKFRDAKSWTEPELAFIANRIAETFWSDFDGISEKIAYQEEFKAARKAWDDYANDLAKSLGVPCVDYVEGQYPEWDKLMKAIDDLQDLQMAKLFEQMGEHGFAKLIIDFPGAFRAMQQLGDQDLMNDDDIVCPRNIRPDEKFTMVAIKREQTGHIGLVRQ